MTARSTLSSLLDEASCLPTNGERLLAATELARAIHEAVLDDSAQLEAVRLAVQETAAAAGCDLIVGASSAADEVVRSLNSAEVVPTRVLLFDLVRITGAALSQASAELRHVDVIPAVLLDLRATTADTALPTSIVVREVARC
jgi:hypothetical protein